MTQHFENFDDVFLAARQGDFDQIEKALKNGFDINTKNEKGHSILMIAAYNAQYTLTEKLIQLGADVNSIDMSGNSILMGVVFKGHNPVFNLLVNAGADLNYVNQKGQSALDFAIMFGRRELILKINKALKKNRSTGRVEQVKTWINYVKAI